MGGQRPTIERIRHHLGRGSPNTVSPYLDAWFAGLGARLADPQAFAQPAGLPASVTQAANYLWEAAQAEARAAAAATYESRQAAVAQHEAALQAKEVALEQERRVLDVKLDAAAHAMGELARARDGAAERAARAEAALESLRAELAAQRDAAQSTLTAEREAAAAALRELNSRRDGERAEWDQERALMGERASSAERRLALEVDAARTAARDARRQMEQEQAGWRARLEKANEVAARHAEEAAAAQARHGALQERLRKAELRLAVLEVVAGRARGKGVDTGAGSMLRSRGGSVTGVANPSGEPPALPRPRQRRRAPNALAGAIRPTRKVRDVQGRG